MYIAIMIPTDAEEPTTIRFVRTEEEPPMHPALTYVLRIDADNTLAAEAIVEYRTPHFSDYDECMRETDWEWLAEVAS